VADSPLDVNEEAGGDQVPVVDIPEMVTADFEWVEDGEPYRGWLVAAEVPNHYPVTEVMDEAGPD
jgi:hypothetical protein